ncbi:flagellar biosynthesis protein FlhB [Hyphomonas sp.]|uniref:EscU/YscU/HrcU family type III secretion system export apparatus switch protein n=1 Tax=Hyphomonas sp. TaxID=87 RepID=UPI00391CB03D
MAEQDQTPNSEKEFEATEQRLRQAREEGDVAQSKEANALALILGMLAAAALLFWVSGKPLFEGLSALLYNGDAYAADIFTGGGEATRAWVASALFAIAPIFLVLIVFVGTALVVQRAIAVSAKKIKPDMKKLSPVENIKKRYGTKGLTDFAKDTAKMLFAGGIGALFLFQFVQEYYGSSAVGSHQFHAFTFWQIIKLVLYFLAFQFLLAAIDMPLQARIHANKLRMSREEMKREMKQSEGDPLLKQQRRERGAKISRGQMLANVPAATVVMVNPTHYSVALKWDPDSGKAPVCVAKGVDNLALKIREIALASGVAIYSDPPTARSLYALVEVDEEIQPEHFAAVAAAIQFAERLKGKA